MYSSISAAVSARLRSRKWTRRRVSRGGLLLGTAVVLVSKGLNSPAICKYPILFVWSSRPRQKERFDFVRDFFTTPRLAVIEQIGRRFYSECILYIIWDRGRCNVSETDPAYQKRFGRIQGSRGGIRAIKNLTLFFFSIPFLLSRSSIRGNFRNIVL